MSREELFQNIENWKIGIDEKFWFHCTLCGKEITGDTEFIRTNSRGLDENEFIETVKDAVDDFRRHCAKTGAVINEKNRVVILARTNRQLLEVAQLLDRHQCSCTVRKQATENKR